VQHPVLDIGDETGEHALCREFSESCPKHPRRRFLPAVSAHGGAMNFSAFPSPADIKLESFRASRAWKSKPPIRFCVSKEVFTMSHVIRLQLIGRVTYYVGWIALVCGGLLHLNIAKTLFLAADLSKRNLFEVSVVCFLICIASELRAHAAPGNELSAAAKRAA
jgi:hypothetical protein